VLGPTAEASDGRPLQSANQPPAGGAAEHVVMGKGNVPERPSHDAGPQLAYDRLDFGELGHARPEFT
jgi:hypothetical protein